MAISDTERREAARKLREIEWRTMPELTDGELLDLLADKVRFGRYGSKNFDEGLLGRIADLIDRPTCRNIGGEDGTNGEYYDFFCSACGFAASVTDPKYCPNCGAEVVE